MKKCILLVLMSTSFFSAFCQVDTLKNADSLKHASGQTDTFTHVSVKADTPACASIANNGKVWASIYQQRAAEYRALCFQAYNMARTRVDMNWRNYHMKPYAIVTDIDETLLDNSPYDAQQALNNLNYDSKTWKEWTAKSICDTVPGAVSFLKYAASKGIDIFYITNREEVERPATLKNLRLYGLPNADNVHLLLKQTTLSSKETRRLGVLKTHKIILLCGDNLPDFDVLYDNNPSEENRKATTDKLMKEFGDRYIILPNPSYDDWEGAIFNYNYNLSNAQKDEIIKAKIRTIK
jgi:5'-nucleotidase (lipoprotein e(P4) family)